MASDSNLRGNSPVPRATTTVSTQPSPSVRLRPLTAPPETPISVAEIPIDRSLTARQVAIILGKPYETVRKWRQRAGQGPKFMRYPRRHDPVSPQHRVEVHGRLHGRALMGLTDSSESSQEFTIFLE